MTPCVKCGVFHTKDVACFVVGQTARATRLEAEHERFAVGDRVRHYGTKQWGVVLEVKPTRYGVELVVERVVEHPSDMTGRGYWEGARIDHHERNGRRAVCP